MLDANLTAGDDSKNIFGSTIVRQRIPMEFTTESPTVTDGENAAFALWHSFAFYHAGKENQ